MAAEGRRIPLHLVPSLQLPAVENDAVELLPLPRRQPVPLSLQRPAVEKDAWPASDGVSSSSAVRHPLPTDDTAVRRTAVDYDRVDRQCIRPVPVSVARYDARYSVSATHVC